MKPPNKFRCPGCRVRVSIPVSWITSRIQGWSMIPVQGFEVHGGGQPTVHRGTPTTLPLKFSLPRSAAFLQCMLLSQSFLLQDWSPHMSGFRSTKVFFCLRLRIPAKGCRGCQSGQKGFVFCSVCMEEQATRPCKFIGVLSKTFCTFTSPPNLFKSVRQHASTVDPS